MRSPFTHSYNEGISHFSDYMLTATLTKIYTTALTEKDLDYLEQLKIEMYELLSACIAESLDD